MGGKEEEVSGRDVRTCITMKKDAREITYSLELDQAMKAFVPVFGSDHDLFILKQIGKYKKMARSVDNVALRSGKKLSRKMEEVLSEEKKLAEIISKRNMDF